MQEQIQWIDRQALLLAHEQSLAIHGGLRGMRDEGLLDSALARPQHLLNYEADTTLAKLAAAYVYGIARNHPFTDGNKRAAFLTLGIFLPLNGWSFEAAPVEALSVMLLVAAGEITEEQLAEWIGQHLVALRPTP